MAQMQALLKIKADVEGEGKVNALGRAIGGLSSTAGRVSGGLKGLAGAAGGLGGALGALVPLATGAGLITLAKNSMDNAAKMFDLSQKTGVSVEALSRFSKAAKVSGTDVDGVTKAMVKLSKGLVEAKNGQGQAGEALRSMGISAVDASGKLKDTDQIMLEISNKFKAMPNGAEKTAMALQLFGKAGADMIPMLNMGGEAISKLGAMSSKYAEDANKGSDAMVTLQGKVGMLGGKLAVVLLPSITAVTESLVRLLDGFNALPGPMQGIIVGAGLLAVSFVALAPAISAVISIAGVLAGLKIGATIAGWAAVIGPAVVGIQAALGGLLAWLGGFKVAALAFISGPAGWTVLAVAAVVAMAIAFRQPITDFLVWMGAGIKAAWAGITSYFQTNLVKPIQDGWRSLTEALPRAMNAAAGMVKNAWRGVLQYIANQINSVGGLINNLILAYNKLPAADIPLIPTMTIPAFAQGGVVSRPTVAMVGDGGEDEYIIPASKMAAASSRFLGGARGAAVIPSGSGSGSTAAGGNPSITVTTGPVLEFDGQRYVTISDFEQGLQQVAGSVYRGLRTPAGRYATGVR
jgi:hypothetical protein